MKEGRSKIIIIIFLELLGWVMVMDFEFLEFLKVRVWSNLQD